MDPSRRAFFRGRSVPSKPGVAQIASSCLARNGVDCRVCGDACDEQAIRFQPGPMGIAQAQIDVAACTGCAECAQVCPSGAIVMAER